jgi:hypothetical protein
MKQPHLSCVHDGAFSKSHSITCEDLTHSSLPNVSNI